MTERLTLSVSETAEQLGIGKNRAYDLVKSGELPSVRIGRTIRIPYEPLKDWLESQVVRSHR